MYANFHHIGKWKGYKTQIGIPITYLHTSWSELTCVPYRWLSINSKHYHLLCVFDVRFVGVAKNTFSSRIHRLENWSWKKGTCHITKMARYFNRFLGTN